MARKRPSFVGLHQALEAKEGVAIQAENMRYTKRTMQALIAEHTGQSVERIERDSDRDHWFSAEEARDYGFVDRVVEHLDDVRPGGGRPAGL